MNLALLSRSNADGLLNYFMVLEGKEHPLNDVPKLGTFYDMRSARNRASEIIKQEVLELPTQIALMLVIQTTRFIAGG
ncbi:hypothetical protein [Burkholderia phage FLC9]|nr:hypothetical protein [Burkholderia phage FLC9]